MTGLPSSPVCPRYKVILVGDQAVGKSSLLRQRIEGTFSENYSTTIACSFKSNEVEIDGVTIQMNIWDTAGQERFRKSLTRSFYRGAQAVIVVFGFNDAASFLNVEHWLADIAEYCGPSPAAKVLVGNKLDTQPHEVRDDNAREFASVHGMSYFPTSATDPESVNTLFDEVARMLLKNAPAAGAVGPAVKLQKEEAAKGGCSC
ncbi:small GTPase superfamily [Auriculariales sp. MPI-PUGE-AT-0066]|nr:small GTPase superfamily [Auriculariales sp. MPI-PUGE-AT-0066]